MRPGCRCLRIGLSTNERNTVTNALPLWAEKLAVFDTETTGIDTAQARVVSSTIALLGASGEVLERYDWLIDPGVEIPQAAANVHGKMCIRDSSRADPCGNREREKRERQSPK